MIAMLSTSSGTFNIYNSTLNGGGSYSAFAARGFNASGYGQINVYDTDISNVNYLVSTNTTNKSTVNTVTTFYSSKVSNVAQWAYEPDFATIVAVGNKIPESLLMEDEVLLQYYDIAASRV